MSRGGRLISPGGLLEGTAWEPQPDLLELVKRQFEHADDIVFRTFRLPPGGRELCVVYAEGMVDTDGVENAIIRPALSACAGGRPGEGHEEPQGAVRVPEPGKELAADPLELLARDVLAAADVTWVTSPEEAYEAVLGGGVLVLVPGERRGLRADNKGGKSRAIENPILEVTLRGPRDSFTEVLAVNTALIRRRLKDPNLRVRKFRVGRRSKTDVALIYLEGIAPERVVEEVRSRIESIDIDGILDTGYIEHLIEDKWWSPFPQHLKSERPDRVVASLLEGRVALIADTTPFALMMPATIDAFFHSPEDSYDRWFPVNILRTVRFIASLLSLTAPSLYVALVAYHPGILPTQLLLKVTAAREGVAFPVVIEALIIMFFLELIKEAGFRMPGPIGQIFGIVGGLILGDVGVRAGIVSEAMVIVVAVTAISSFTAIDREMGTVLRLLGLPVLLSAAVFGLPGLVMALLLVLIHVAILRSYGVPYVDPYPFFKLQDIQDTIVEMPIGARKLRPAYLGSKKRRRLRGPSGGRGGGRRRGEEGR